MYYYNNVSLCLLPNIRLRRESRHFRLRPCKTSSPSASRSRTKRNTANPRTKILDFRGFDSSIISISRGGIPRPIGDFPKSLSQAILAGIISVGRSGVARPKPADPTGGNKVDDANKVNMQLGRRCSRAALDNVTNNCNNNNVLINVLIIELLSMY